LRLLVATTNHGKVKEFRRVLALTPSPSTLGEGRGEGSSPHPSSLVSRLFSEITDLTAFAPIPAVEETGSTFLANACLKATYYARAFNSWTLADDSGLAVDALNGKPGIHSARWSEMNGRPKGDVHNNQLLLEQLKNVCDADRGAQFVCALALSDPQGRIILTVTDQVEGRILHQPAGAGGFGYDPLFFLDSHGMTTAELPPAEKDALSHRGKAARTMLALIQKHLT
jgi:XTP/dITP diphosphohydrolase